MIIFFYRLVQFQQISRKILAIRQLNRLVVFLFVFGFIFRIKRIVDGIQSQIGMQFAWIALIVAAVVIVYPVSNIRSLLNLGQQNSFSNRMNTSRGNKKNITLSHFLKFKYVSQFNFFEFFKVFFLINLLVKSRLKFRS